MPLNRTATVTAHRQRGAVLLVSLMILLIMTVLGVAGMTTTTMEEKMSANNQQQQQAYAAAETALRDAERWLTNNVTSIADLAAFDGTGGLYATRPTAVGGVKSPPTFDLFSQTDWQSKGVSSLSLLSNQAAPRYIIEYLGEIDAGGGSLDPNMGPRIYQRAFRITAVGWSVDGSARYMGWSHYKRRLN